MQNKHFLKKNTTGRLLQMLDLKSWSTLSNLAAKLSLLQNIGIVCVNVQTAKLSESEGTLFPALNMYQ